MLDNENENMETKKTKDGGATFPSQEFGGLYTTLTTIGVDQSPHLVSLWDIIMECFTVKGNDVIWAIHLWEMFIATQRTHLFKRQWKDYALEPEIIKNLVFLADQACKIATELGLKFSLQKATQLKMAAGMLPFSATHAIQMFSDVREAFTHELQTVLFLRATDDMVEHLDKKQPFGVSVSTAFPECVEDLEEAHQCFALARYTASMFHLGRAMESAVKLVAKKAGAKIPKKDNWQHYSDAINAAIKAMPFNTLTQRNKREPFAGVANYLFNFKEAWRNQTAHPKKTYTRQEARDLLSSAQAFFQYAAVKVFKKKADL